jgi:hypothetical protein
VTKRTSKAWSGKLNKRKSPKLPAWKLGLVPSPDRPDEFQEFGRKAKAYYDECDQIEEAERKRSGAVLLEFLGCAPGDYEAGFVRLAERCVPAFKKAEKRGRQPDFHGKLQLLVAFEREKRETETDTEVLLRLYPEIKTEVELNNKRKRLAEARAWRDRIRSV